MTAKAITTIYRAADRIRDGRELPGDRDMVAEYARTHPRSTKLREVLGTAPPARPRLSAPPPPPPDPAPEVTSSPPAPDPEPASSVPAGAPPPIAVYPEDVPPPPGEPAPEPKPEAEPGFDAKAFAERKAAVDELTGQMVGLMKVGGAIARSEGVIAWPDTIIDKFFAPAFAHTIDACLPAKMPQVNPHIITAGAAGSQLVAAMVAVNRGKKRRRAEAAEAERAKGPADPGVANAPPPEPAPEAKPEPAPEPPPSAADPMRVEPVILRMLPAVKS